MQANISPCSPLSLGKFVIPQGLTRSGWVLCRDVRRWCIQCSRKSQIVLHYYYYYITDTVMCWAFLTSSSVMTCDYINTVLMSQPLWLLMCMVDSLTDLWLPLLEDLKQCDCLV